MPRFAPPFAPLPLRPFAPRAALALALALAACGGSTDLAPQNATGTASGGAGVGGGSGGSGNEGGADAGGSGPGGGPGSGGSGGGDVQQACDDAASAFCTKYDECFAFTLTLVYGDVATCAAQIAQGCVNGQTAPGTGTTLDKLAACAQEYASISCAELQGPDATASLPSCEPAPGNLEDGTGCFADAQCKSTLCKKVDGAACGTCAARGPAGAPCDGGDCETGLTCSQAGTCAPLGDLGDACGPDAPCAFAFSCSMGTCAAPAKAGDPCAPMQMGSCPFQYGLFCHPQTQTCTDFAFADAGEACGVTPPVFTLCAGSGSCNDQPSGTCDPPAAEGGMCDPSPQAGPNCLPPATCDAGTCVVPSTTSCP